jgi:hypothetical protein
MALLGTAGQSQALNAQDATGTGAGTGAVNLLTAVALHTASPGTTGTSENANAGSYARQATAWSSSSAGSAKTNSSALTFSTLGTIAVTHVAGWSSSAYAGGTYGMGAPLGSSVTAASITVASGAISLTAS